MAIFRSSESLPKIRLSFVFWEDVQRVKCDANSLHLSGIPQLPGEAVLKKRFLGSPLMSCGNNGVPFGSGWGRNW